MTVTGERINVYTTKECRMKILRATTYSKRSLEEETSVDTLQLLKLSRGSHCTENTHRCTNMRKEHRLLKSGQICQYMWKFPVLQGTENSPWLTLLYSGLWKTQQSCVYPGQNQGFSQTNQQTHWRHFSEKLGNNWLWKCYYRAKLSSFCYFCVPRK